MAGWFITDTSLTLQPGAGRGRGALQWGKIQGSWPIVRQTFYQLTIAFSNSGLFPRGLQFVFCWLLLTPLGLHSPGLLFLKVIELPPTPEFPWGFECERNISEDTRYMGSLRYGFKLSEFTVGRSAGTTEERGCALDSPLENNPISVSVSVICLHLYNHSFIHSLIHSTNEYRHEEDYCGRTGC